MSHEVLTRYQRAERLLPDRHDRLVFGAVVEPQFLGGADRFWYRVTTRDGARFVLVDANRGERSLLFDHDRLASALSAARAIPCTAGSLPFTTVELLDDGKAVAVTVDDERWRCDLTTYECAALDLVPPPSATDSVSPDGRTAAFAREGDLWVRDLASGEERRLTSNAEPGLQYASPTDVGGMPLIAKQLGMPEPALVAWSPDSTHLVTHRVDEREVPLLHLTQSCPPDGSVRPTHHTLHYAMPGDPLPVATLLVFNVTTGEAVTVDRTIEVPFLSPLQCHRVWWSGGQVWFIADGRGGKTLELLTCDPTTGTTRCVVRETGPTYVELTPLISTPPLVRLIESTGEVLWYSERDGWAHLYLYDGSTGELKNQVTSGAFAVRELLHVDEAARTVLFVAGGREAGRNPYLRHVYRVHLDGTGMELLTPEDADHSVTVSPSGRFLVDTQSQYGEAPVTVLRSADGQVLVELETADLSVLFEGGFRWPEPFTVKAADGVTSLHGILYTPSDLDPSRSYPIVDSIYPGPQMARQFKQTLHGMSIDPMLLDTLGGSAAVAELGFAVVVLDGRGTPLRSKEFHDASYGRLDDPGFLVDHVAAIQQLARTRPWMDLSRVGIYGHSGGGCATARALVNHPEFYSVGIASAGNHDQRSYYALWGEIYQGLLDGDNYAGTFTAALADRLVGKLLVVHGELDDNVHPGMALQLVKAFIDAHKDVDLLYVPGGGHSYGPADAYVERRKWDYLVRHLQGVEPPAGYRIASPQP